MRWRPRPHDQMHWIHWLWLGPLAVPFALLLVPLFVCEWLEKKKLELMGPSKHWRPWFAWYPVRFNFSDECVWLEWIERKKEWDWNDYRPAPAPSLAKTGGHSQ